MTLLQRYAQVVAKLATFLQLHSRGSTSTNSHLFKEIQTTMRCFLSRLRPGLHASTHVGEKTDDKDRATGVGVGIPCARGPGCVRVLCFILFFLGPNLGAKQPRNTRGVTDYHQLRSEEEINSKSEDLTRISCREKSTGSQGQHTTSNTYFFICAGNF
jgi:hypothetical protein